MNIGIILPAEKSVSKRKAVFRLFQTLGPFPLKIHPLEINKIELVEGLNLVACTITLNREDIFKYEGLRRKLKNKMERIFEEERAWPVLEHPLVRGCFQSHDWCFDEANREVVVNRFTEVLKLIHGIGDLSAGEVAITGGAAHLEFAIVKLITKVKLINLLIPEGSIEPHEAEQAFIETGIPVHITSDHDVLSRTKLWIRFPDDDASFDVLPGSYRGIIIDLGEMKIIDTKNEKIFNITLEFSDRIKRKIGQSIMEAWSEGVLEGVVLTVCANAWDTSVTESSIRLGMRISFHS